MLQWRSILFILIIEILNCGGEEGRVVTKTGSEGEQAGHGNTGRETYSPVAPEEKSCLLGAASKQTYSPRRSDALTYSSHVKIPRAAFASNRTSSFNCFRLLDHSGRLNIKPFPSYYKEERLSKYTSPKDSLQRYYIKPPSGANELSQYMPRNLNKWERAHESFGNPETPHLAPNEHYYQSVLGDRSRFNKKKKINENHIKVRCPTNLSNLVCHGDNTIFSNALDKVTVLENSFLKSKEDNLLVPPKVNSGFENFREALTKMSSLKRKGSTRHLKDPLPPFNEDIKQFSQESDLFDDLFQKRNTGESGDPILKDWTGINGMYNSPDHKYNKSNELILRHKVFKADDNFSKTKSGTENSNSSLQLTPKPASSANMKQVLKRSVSPIIETEPLTSLSNRSKRSLEYSVSNDTDKTRLSLTNKRIIDELQRMTSIINSTLDSSSLISTGNPKKFHPNKHSGFENSNNHFSLIKSIYDMNGEFQPVLQKLNLLLADRTAQMKMLEDANQTEAIGEDKNRTVFKSSILGTKNGSLLITERKLETINNELDSGSGKYLGIPKSDKKVSQSHSFLRPKRGLKKRQALSENLGAKYNLKYTRKNLHNALDHNKHADSAGNLESFFHQRYQIADHLFNNMAVNETVISNDLLKASSPVLEMGNTCQSNILEKLMKARSRNSGKSCETLRKMTGRLKNFPDNDDQVVLEGKPQSRIVYDSLSQGREIPAFEPNSSSVNEVWPAQDAVKSHQPSWRSKNKKVFNIYSLPSRSLRPADLSLKYSSVEAPENSEMDIRFSKENRRKRNLVTESRSVPSPESILNNSEVLVEQVELHA